MSHFNKFYGLEVTGSTVGDYYNNPNVNNFAAFIFQPVMFNSTAGENDYNLIGYAIDQDGNVLNFGNTISSIPITTNPFSTDKANIHFANMKLDVNGLYQLYPPGTPITATLTIKADHWDATGFVVFTATTPVSEHQLTLRTVALKPSPPY